MTASTLLALLLLLSACGDDDRRGFDGSRPDGGAPAGDIPAELVGGWYGSGAMFPDGDLCVAICDNARLFVGDRPCTETTAGDFAGGYYTASTMAGVAGYTVVARDSAGATELQFTASVSGSSATFTFTELGALPFQRMVPAFALCNDTSVPPR